MENEYYLLLTGDQGHGLSPRAWIRAKATEHRRGNGLCVGFPDASQSHARVRSLDHNHHANRFSPSKSVFAISVVKRS